MSMGCGRAKYLSGHIRMYFFNSFPKKGEVLRGGGGRGIQAYTYKQHQSIYMYVHILYILYIVYAYVHM